MKEILAEVKGKIIHGVFDLEKNYHDVYKIVFSDNSSITFKSGQSYDEYSYITYEFEENDFQI